MKASKNRRYTFTINNPLKDKKDYLDLLTQYAVKYAILGNEVGKKEMTPHIQGFVSFVNAVSFEKLRLLLDKGHLEIAHGSDTDNQNYCSKDNDFIEYGKPSIYTSTGDNMNAFVKDCRSGGLTSLDLIERYPDLFLKHYHNAMAIYEAFNHSQGLKGDARVLLNFQNDTDLPN